MKTGQTISLRVGMAKQNCVEDFALPSGWDATIYPPADAPALDGEGTREALTRPVAGEPISVAAGKAQSAVILVDDFRRPTPAKTLCMAVLDEFEAAGLKEDQLAIILGNGAHRVMTKAEVRKRIGAAMDRVGTVVSHDAYSPDVKFLGLTEAGTPVLVNAVAADADFSVSISMVYPHALTSWGGGAKMILPGISHVSTINYHHGRVAGGPWAGTPGKCKSRRDLEQAADLLGLDVSLCAVINSGGEMCGLFVGTPREAHRAAVAQMRKTADTPVDGGPFDLVIANAYPLDADGTQYSKAQAPVQQFGCPMLVVSDFTDPSTYHGLYDGPIAPYRRREPIKPPPHTDELLMNAPVFFYSPQYGDGFVPPNRDWYGDNDWERLMQAMARRFKRARVGIFPAAPLQIPRKVNPR